MNMVRAGKFDARVEELQAMRDLVEAAMHEFGISNTGTIFQVLLAVDEACTNVARYAYGGSPGTLELECSFDDPVLTILLRDHGSPFDPRNAPDPDLSAGVEDRNIGGLGVFLIREIMDNVKYSFSDENGNELVMEKRIGPDERT